MKITVHGQLSPEASATVKKLYATGTGLVTKIHGTVNTLMLPILQFTVKADHHHYIPGNLMLINQVRYWIRARTPDEPTVGHPVKLVLYRDYTTRAQRVLNRKKFAQQLSQAQAASYSRAKNEQIRLGYTEPTLENGEAHGLQ